MDPICYLLLNFGLKESTISQRVEKQACILLVDCSRHNKAVHSHELVGACDLENGACVGLVGE